MYQMCNVSKWTWCDFPSSFCVWFCAQSWVILWSVFHADWFDLITARKRSLGQGNVFTNVCHSVHGGWGRGCLPLGPTGIHPPGHTPGRDGHWSRRCASYWNAFLFNIWFAFIDMFTSFIKITGTLSADTLILSLNVLSIKGTNGLIEFHSIDNQECLEKWTRMHSSRMCTARSLTVSRSKC